MIKELLNKIREKLNPAQQVIAFQEGYEVAPQNIINFANAYDKHEIVRNGVDKLVNASASFDVNITETLPFEGQAKGIRKKKLEALLNYQPNPFQDIYKFRRLIFTDMVLEGNAFLYFDGNYLYNLPASSMSIIPDEKSFIKKYVYEASVDKEITFSPEEIIHISDNSSTSMYRGTGRLKSADGTLKSIGKMKDFQDNYFKNGTVVGLVLKSPNVLSQGVKDRLIQSWQEKYNPQTGGKRPLILDGGLELDRISNTTFQELDFQNSIDSKERTILKALGIPPILLDGGNNANIAPNLKLFYLETVLPLVKMVLHAYERYFAYNLELELSKISALQPEFKDSALYYSTLVNTGIISPNEAREELRYDPMDGHDDLRVPANIAGSAANPSEGGRPKKGDNE